MYIVYNYSTNTTTRFLYFFHHHPYLILHFYEMIFILTAATFFCKNLDAYDMYTYM